MGFFRKENWSWLPFPSPGDFPDPGSNPGLLCLPASGGGFLTTSTIYVYMYTYIHTSLGFPGGSVVKNPPANVGDVGSIPGLGRFPREGNVNTLQYLAWEIPRTEEPGGLQSMGLQKSQV